MNRKISMSWLLVGVLVLVILISFWRSHPEDKKNYVTNFDACARAGYPIMESYPRQCRTPEGRIFVEEAVSGICRYPQECGPNFYCRHGVCTELTPEQECKRDEDCQLINAELSLSCCWAGACQVIDYSEDRWIAVNADWFAQMGEEFCPSKEECGPGPLCPVQSRNEKYQAKCVPIQCIRAPCPTGMCEKRPL